MGGGADKAAELNLEGLNLNRESNRMGCIRAMCKVNARAKEKKIQRIAHALEICVLSSKPECSLAESSTEKGKLGFKRKFSSDLVADALNGVEDFKGPEFCCYCRPRLGDVCQFCVSDKFLRV